MAFEPSRKQITLSAVEGNYESRFGQVKLVLHGFEKVKHIEVNGEVLKVEHKKHDAFLVMPNYRNEMVIKY